jgi:hypothetical protein
VQGVRTLTGAEHVNYPGLKPLGLPVAASAARVPALAALMGSPPGREHDSVWPELRCSAPARAPGEDTKRSDSRRDPTAR